MSFCEFKLLNFKFLSVIKKEKCPKNKISMPSEVCVFQKHFWGMEVLSSSSWVHQPIETMDFAVLLLHNAHFAEEVLDVLPLVA